jgi:hypothetical protein
VHIFLGFFVCYLIQLPIYKIDQEQKGICKIKVGPATVPAGKRRAQWPALLYK